MQVVILTSSFGHVKRDEQIRTAPYRYLNNTENESIKKQFNDLSWIPLEPKKDEFNGESVLQISGGGFAKTLFELFKRENVSCTIVLKFCSEGDNIPDACELINHLNQWLKLIPVDKKNIAALKFPASWKFLFGNSPPKELY